MQTDWHVWGHSRHHLTTVSLKQEHGTQLSKTNHDHDSMIVFLRNWNIPAITYTSLQVQSMLTSLESLLNNLGKNSKAW